MTNLFWVDITRLIPTLKVKEKLSWGKKILLLYLLFCGNPENCMISTLSGEVLPLPVWNKNVMAHIMRQQFIFLESFFNDMFWYYYSDKSLVKDQRQGMVTFDELLTMEVVAIAIPINQEDHRHQPREVINVRQSPIFLWMKKRFDKNFVFSFSFLIELPTINRRLLASENRSKNYFFIVIHRCATLSDEIVLIGLNSTDFDRKKCSYFWSMEVWK